MKKNKNITNNVGISRDPYSFEKLFKGRCNDLEFHLIYSGSYNAGTESMDDYMEIVWQSEVEESRAKILEDGIKKLFRSRLNGDKK